MRANKTHFATLEMGFECSAQPVTNWCEYKRTLPEAAHEFPSAAVVVAE
ncbi:MULTISPECIES: hypothetical protein [Bartonella]|nr:hypothetical protein [Bartonella grahamii]